MKTMTYNQLGGACDKSFSANTFEEMAELSKQHGTEMFQAKDAPHMEAMNKMMELMKSPDAMMAWFDEKDAAFNALPEDQRYLSTFLALLKNKTQQTIIKQGALEIVIELEEFSNDLDFLLNIYKQ